MLTNSAQRAGPCYTAHSIKRVHTETKQLPAIEYVFVCSVFLVCYIAGFRAGDLIRVGFSTADVLSTAPEPRHLSAGGVSLTDLAAAGLPPTLRGLRGLSRLRAAGYSAGEVLSAGLASPWAAREAGGEQSPSTGTYTYHTMQVQWESCTIQFLCH